MAVRIDDFPKPPPLDRLDSDSLIKITAASMVDGTEEEFANEPVQVAGLEWLGTGLRMGQRLFDFIHEINLTRVVPFLVRQHALFFREGSLIVERVLLTATKEESAQLITTRARFIAEKLSEANNALRTRKIPMGKKLPIAHSGYLYERGNSWIFHVLPKSAQKGTLHFSQLAPELQKAARTNFDAFRRIIKDELRAIGASGKHPSLGEYVIIPNPSIETMLFRPDGSIGTSISPVVIRYSQQAKNALRLVPKLTR